jgi:NTP pyrophosphatase (non-canonical NTP hydrolase)
MKLMEEVGELMAAILKNDREQQVDAVGDIMVVLAILSNQIGVSIPTALKVAFNEIKDRTGKTINGAFIKQQDL